MHFDRFDICEAYYVYARDYHTGQGSREYAILSRLKLMGFRPTDGLYYYSLTENGREIYDSLIENVSQQSV